VASEKNYFTRESSSDTKSAAKVPTKALIRLEQYSQKVINSIIILKQLKKNQDATNGIKNNDNGEKCELRIENKK